MPDRPDNDLPRPERTPVEEKRDWETLQQNDTDMTQRLRIAGGWLYRTIIRNAAIGGDQVAMVYVPLAADQ